MNSFLIKLIATSVVFFIILIVGALTATAPDFVVRLLPILILFIFFLFAFLGKNSKSIEDSTLKIWLTVLLSVMALWPTYMLIKIGGLPTIDARRITAGLSIAAMFFFMIARKPAIKTLTQNKTGVLRFGKFLLISYVLWRITSCFTAILPVASLIQVLWETIYYYSMFFISAIFFRKSVLQEWMMKVFMILAILVSFYTGIEWIAKKNILMQFAPTGEDFAEFRNALSLARERDGVFRAQGTFEHPILLAEFSAMGVCFGLTAMLWQNKSKNFKVLGFVTLVFSVIAAILTGSRSALVASAVGIALIVMLWLFSPKQSTSRSQQFSRKLLFIIGIVCMVGISIPTAQLLVEGKSHSEATSTLARAQMLEMGLASIEKYPLLGLGPGNFSVAAIKTGSGVTTLDNYFLAVTIESGIPALLLLLGCLLYPCWVLFNELMKGGQQVAPFFAATMGCLVVTVLVHVILWMPYNLFFIFLFSGSALASVTREKNMNTVTLQK